MFTPGETAIHSFIIPFPQTEIDEIIVSYRQQNDIILEVPITSSQVRDVYDETGAEPVYLYSIFDVLLTEDQSLLFQEFNCSCGNNNYTAQVNVLLGSGSRFTSIPITKTNGTQFYREVMGDG